jgi:hypothetical protein
VNASGLIESVASGVLRLDYPVTGGCPAALIEASGTNLAFNSQTWATGTNWNLSNTTTATGTTGTLDPLGTNTANAISPTAVSGVHTLQSNNPTSISYTSGTIYTQSAFFKQGTGDAGRYVQLTFTGLRFTQLSYANFDLQTGAVVASGGTADANRAASIENYGNGWYRCRFTATCDSTGTGIGVIPNLITASGDTRAPSFTGVTGDVLYGWGAQLETGAIPTSYIPTTTGSATRNADVCSVSGVSGYIGQTEGTIYAEVLDVDILDNPIFSIDDGSNNNRIVIYRTPTTGLWNIFSSSNGVNTLGSGTVSSNNGKLALAYSSSGIILYRNGVQVATSSGALPLSFSAIRLNGRVTNDLYSTKRLRAAAIYTTRLTNDQLANLTRLT